MNHAPRAVLRWPVVRFAVLLALWSVLIGGAPLDLAVGMLAAAAGTAVSLRFLPGSAAVAIPAALRFALRFLGQSLLAGFDVARRAFDPALPLSPGLVIFRPSLRPGFARDLFTTISSMMPGTLPIGEDGHGGLVIHCLDMRQPVAVEMAQDEARLRRAIGGGRSHG